MKLWTLTALTVTLAACQKPLPSPLPVSVVPSAAAARTCTVVRFCRDDGDDIQQAGIDALTLKGLRYVGVLNANGINCNHTLWCKETP